ncbi:phage head-tail joining protein [Azospirillum doebereinerae]|uniref:phage head-tail joining protein n=1 Tax=Azospirillum doebereinerae TaxID=92933 RepID=UPI00163BAB64|nr:hypothetical protein [Azospirillum doebereinerae]
MATTPELEARLEQLLKARANDARLVQRADGSRVEYRTGAELDTAIQDLEKRLAARKGRAVGPVYQRTRSVKDL